MEYKIKDVTEESGGSFTVIVIVPDGNQLGRAIDALRSMPNIQECRLKSASFQKGNWHVDFYVRVRDGVQALAAALVLRFRLDEALHWQLPIPFEEEHLLGTSEPTPLGPPVIRRDATPAGEPPTRPEGTPTMASVPRSIPDGN